ncbi:hypothetical protein L596_014078 [Steinernema carpocapsae]|nr:hypothetical protein L596_014078 [Steinernema carpocapsae]
MLRDLSVYRSEFEVHFISATSQFYHEESRQHLQDHNASIYLRMVQKIIVEESLRAERYLDPTTKEILLDVLDDELLSAHKTTILEMEGSGIAAMLGGKKTEDLKLLYALFGRIEDGVKLMAEHVSRYVRSQGAEAVNALGETAETPSHFVNTISKLKQVVDDLVREAFDSDELVKSKVRNDFEHIMNLKERSPEYLSRFIDHLLCSGHSRVLNVRCSGRRDPKHVHLAVPLPLREGSLRAVVQTPFGATTSPRQNRKRRCGKVDSAQTQGRMRQRLHGSLEGMFKDISVSQDTMNLFRDYLCRREPRSKDIGLSVKVVAGVNWPVSAAPKPCTLPPTLSNAFQEFKAFYQKQHRGRTLMLNPVWGHVDLKATFFGGRKARGQQEVCASQARNMKMLQVSTYQALILLRFNHKPTHTYRELLDETAIPEEDLKRCLVSLSYSSRGISCVLLRPNDQGAEIGLDEEFTVNDGYSSARSKINLCVLLKNEGEPSIKETRAKTERDRKHEVEAAIVRVMKARQEMPHAHLTAEVTNHLKARFLPSPQMIKERVESLIERDYLGRDTKDRRIIKYMS